MKKFILSLLISLASFVPAVAQPVWSVIDRSTFRVEFQGPNGKLFGTAFCAPGKINMLMTAGHVARPGIQIYDWQGREVHVKTVTYRDEKKDIGVIMLDEPACTFSANQWALKNEAPSARLMTLYGYATGVKTLTTGNISGVPGDVDEWQVGGQTANLNALGGHSGGPVYNPEGKIVGMLVGSAEAHDVIDVIIPVEALRKVLK